MVDLIPSFIKKNVPGFKRNNKSGIPVYDVMIKEPFFISPKTSVKSCSEKIAKHNIGSMLIREEGKIIGIVTKQDLVKKVIAKGLSPSKLKVKDIMTKKLITVNPHEDLSDAVKLMIDNKVEQLPVTEKTEFKGLLTWKQILKIQPKLMELYFEKCKMM